MLFVDAAEGSRGRSILRSKNICSSVYENAYSRKAVYICPIIAAMARYVSLYGTTMGTTPFSCWSAATFFSHRVKKAVTSSLSSAVSI